jgi:4-amino-4-deoxy-L-arabinose transferase-like glycosyltransferase
MGSAGRFQGNWKGLTVVTVVCLAGLLPFVDKAFHIDDTLFLRVARQIHEHPTDFYGFRIIWYFTEKPMAQITKNPPLAAYFTALVTSVWGWGELPLHLAFLVPALGVAWGSYYLAQRFCSRPALAAIIGMLTPAFLVSSTSIMCDTMMLAFWLWAMICWDRGISQRRAGLLIAAALLIGLGFLTKYFAVSLIPLLFAYSWRLRRRPWGWWLLPLLIPVAIMAGYQWLTHRLYDQDLFSDAINYAKEVQHKSSHFASLWDKLVIGLTFAGGCLASAAFFFPWLWSRRGVGLWLVAIGCLVYVLYIRGHLGPFKLVLHGEEDIPDSVRWSAILQIGLLAIAGAGVLALALMDLWERRDPSSLLLFLWVFGTFIFTAFVNWTVNARSIFPAAPAVGILVVRRLERLQRLSAGWIQWRLMAPVAGAAILSMLVARADYQFANSARQAALEIHHRFADLPGTIWFEGHWGFQYYMEEHGAHILDTDTMHCEPGDLAVLPLNNCDLYMLPADSTEKIEPSVVVPTSAWDWTSKVFGGHPLGIATMHPILLAGFYATGFGPLPFVFGDVPKDEYVLYQVTKPIHAAIHFQGKAPKFEMIH